MSTPRGTDPAAMRRANMALILRHLRDHGGRSRARLAGETGLSKASMTTLIAELEARGLVAEGEPDRERGIGRPGLLVDLDGVGACGIGVEVSLDYLSMIALDLTGSVIRETVRPLNTPALSVGEVAQRVARLLDDTLVSLRTSGARPVGVTIGMPGFTDADTGFLRSAPNLGWKDVAFVHEVTSRMNEPIAQVRVQNDAKLAAIAQHALAKADGVQDLVYVTGDVGIGGGIIAGGALMTGVSGFSGEIGHLRLDPWNRPCPCGRTGCWERWVGLDGMFELVADEGDPVRDPSVDIEERLREVHRRVETGDEHARAGLASVAQGLGEGLSVIADVLNPARIVLGGYFTWFPEELVVPADAYVRASRLNTFGDKVSVVASTLGLTAAARGGAHDALAGVFLDPTSLEPAVA